MTYIKEMNSEDEKINIYYLNKKNEGSYFFLRILTLNPDIKVENSKTIFLQGFECQLPLNFKEGKEEEEEFT